MVRLLGLAAWTGVLLVHCWPAPGQEAEDASIRKSVVKISTVQNPLDPFRPWARGHSEEVTGSGVVISGNRVLTNAHVVNHSSQIFIQPDKSTEKFEASVVALAAGDRLGLAQA